MAISHVTHVHIVLSSSITLLWKNNKSSVSTIMYSYRLFQISSIQDPYGPWSFLSNLQFTVILLFPYLLLDSINSWHTILYIWKYSCLLNFAQIEFFLKLSNIHTYSILYPEDYFSNKNVLLKSTQQLLR